MAGPRKRADRGARVDADPWLSKEEAVAHTGVSARTLERAVARGELEAGGTIGRRLFQLSKLDAWLASWRTTIAVAAVVVVAALAMCLAGVGPVRTLLHRLHCPLAQLEASILGRPSGLNPSVVLGSADQPVTISRSIPGGRKAR